MYVRADSGQLAEQRTIKWQEKLFSPKSVQLYYAKPELILMCREIESYQHGTSKLLNNELEERYRDQVRKLLLRPESRESRILDPSSETANLCLFTNTDEDHYNAFETEETQPVIYPFKTPSNATNLRPRRGAYKK